MPTWLWVLLTNAVAGILISFGAYIWRNMEGRVKAMEDEEKRYSDKQIDRPFLTIEAHEERCDRNTNSMKSLLESLGKQLAEKMVESEKRTALLIDLAISEAGKNGRTKRTRK